MKYLGIDYGLAYLGLSVGDDESRVAVPMDTIRETDLKRQAITIEQIVADEEIDAVVVGNPLTLEGEEQEQVQRTLAFINELSGRIELKYTAKMNVSARLCAAPKDGRPRWEV